MAQSSTTATADDERIPTAPPDLFAMFDIDPSKDYTKADDGFTIDVEWQDVESPDTVPTSAKETEVELAERILEVAISHDDYGHHETLSRAITGFANDHRDDDSTPDFWRRRAYQLSPNELNFGTLEPVEDRDDDSVPNTGPTDSMYEKARVIIAWASTAFETRMLRDIELELAREYADEWQTAIETAEQQRRAAEFITTLPDEHNGWDRIPTPKNALAYAGPPTNHDGTLDEDTDAHGEFIILFFGDGHHRLYTYAFEDYHLFNPAKISTIDTHTVKRDRRTRVGNPTDWFDGVIQLLDHIEAVTWPDDANLPPAAMENKAHILAELPEDAITAALDEFDDLTHPNEKDTTPGSQTGLGDF